jgi:tetratricopeptide (TPR) repeat protein
MVRAAIIVALSCLFGLVPAWAQHPFERFPALYDTLVGSHYDAAWEIHRALESEFPEHPATLLSQVVILYTEMIDFEDTTGEAEFFRNCNELMAVCESRRKDANEKEGAELDFISGSTLAMRAFYAGRRGELWSAATYIARSRSLFSRAIENDPSLFDAYLGRGAYRWGVAKQAGILAGAPFLPSREDALADLKLALQSSRFSRHAAANTLIWFLVEDKKFDEAETLLKNELERFPDARSLLWPLISLQYHAGRYRECIASSEELIRQYQMSPRNNGYDVVGLCKRMADAATQLGNDEAVVEYCRAGLATPMSDYARQRRIRDLETLAKWSEKAEKRLSQQAKK